MTLEIQGMAPLLSVFDMPVSVHFYRNVLGFELISNSPHLSQSQDDFHWALLRRDGIELMLNTAYDEGQRPQNPDPLRIAAHGDTVLYRSCPNVEEAHGHLLNLGLQLKPPSIAPYGMKQLQLCDPDGYGICFQWPA